MRDLALVLLFCAPIAFAGPVYKDRKGVAIDGYDVVSYFESHTAREGAKAFAVVLDGTTWRFVSQAHADAFQKNPNQYLPQYGGYCANAIAAKDELVETDPEAFDIVGGKLYLNYSKRIQRKWKEDQPAYIKQGDLNFKKH